MGIYSWLQKFFPTFLMFLTVNSYSCIQPSVNTFCTSIKAWMVASCNNVFNREKFKLGTSNVYHKRNKMTPTILLPWQHPWLQSLSVKNQISPLATFLSGTGGLRQNRHGAHIVLTLPIRLLGVDDPCVRRNLGILIVIKTESAV